MNISKSSINIAPNNIGARLEPVYNHPWYCSRNLQIKFSFRCLAKVLGLEETEDRKPISVFDPINTKSEENIIQLLGYECTSKNNLEGKYVLKDEPLYSGTLFYLPHCPKQLTNNILWANWQPETLGAIDPTSFDSRCEHGLYILGNSFERITSSLPDRILK